MSDLKVRKEEQQEQVRTLIEDVMTAKSLLAGKEAMNRMKAQARETKDGPAAKTKNNKKGKAPPAAPAPPPPQPQEE
jgi:hypothetical protein